MDVDLADMTITDNPDAGRFEARIAGQLAVAAYRRSGDRIIFTHTEVPDALEGHGIAGKLVRTALDAARADQLKVVPLCEFVTSYIRRHQEYVDLVDPEHQATVANRR